MTVPRGHKGLFFPCECVSALNQGYSDPWAEITKNRLLPNGTKEEILNLVADEPKTLSQLAQALSLSPPSVHTHVRDLMKSELLRESAKSEKKYPTERYYEPNFPVFKAEECVEFRSLWLNAVWLKRSPPFFNASGRSSSKHFAKRESPNMDGNLLT